MKQIILTGIKPTGVPHIGNYFGAIKPALELSKKNPDSECYYFIADYHALTTITSSEVLKNYTYQVAATWLACGLDPKNVIFYKQSDVPETFELYTILTNLTPKGLMNRAHAYKAKIDENLKNNVEIDSNVNMGLYNYPILMAADILLFNTSKVPVGKDQKQHVEIARDIAQYFNNRYEKTFVLPEVYLVKDFETIIGTDGRKMSKSYNNTIQLFSDEKTLEKTIKKIVTDSKGVDEPKGTDNAIYDLYKLFSNEDELKDFENQLKSGIGWGEAKSKLFTKINNFLSPMREKYNYYMQNTHLIDDVLQEGASVARKEAKIILEKVKKAVGVK